MIIENVFENIDKYKDVDRIRVLIRNRHSAVPM